MNGNEIQSHAILIRGLIVFYRTAGDPSHPPLVLLNGWGARLSGRVVASDRIIRAFAHRGWRVYSPEHPGLMRSEPPKEIWSFKDYADYVEKFVMRVGIQNPVIVGQSFGGAIATAYAARHPEKIRMLVLVDAGLGQGFGRRFRRLNIFFPPAYLHMVAARWIPVIIKKFAVWSSLGVPWGHIKKETLAQRAIMQDIFRQWFLPNFYAKITTPTVLIWGKKDRLFPLKAAERVAKILPYAKLIPVRGGHNVLYARPEEIAEIALREVRRTDLLTRPLII